MIRTALYARISQDRTGDGLSVARQRADCEQLALDRGWDITSEYVDNDLSAYSGKSRPGFEAMLADIAAKKFDAVVAYHADRVTRRPVELEQFLETCLNAGVKLFATVQGDTNIGKGDDILVARIFAAVAANASDAASRRIKRKNDERADAGLPHISGQRAYGYALDRMTVVEAEAQVIRTLASRFVSGESLYSLANWLQAEQIKTATGTNDWRTPTLRNLLKSPRIAGLREHRGEVRGPAAWPAIITMAQHHQITARLERTANDRVRTPRTYLLSGKVYCGLCGSKMVSAPDSGRRRYGCRSGADFQGCGKVYVTAPGVEDLIADAILLRLDSPEVAKTVFAESDSTSQLETLAQEIQSSGQQIDELAAAYADREITMREWLLARRPVEDRMTTAKQQMSRIGQQTNIVEHLGRGKEIAAVWNSEEMTLARQVAVMNTVLEKVIIYPGQAKARKLNPERVKAIWLV